MIELLGGRSVYSLRPVEMKSPLRWLGTPTVASIAEKRLILVSPCCAPERDSGSLVE